MCSLCPKHANPVHLLICNARTMFEPLSVVMHTRCASSKPQADSASFSPFAKKGGLEASAVQIVIIIDEVDCMAVWRGCPAGPQISSGGEGLKVENLL